MRSKLLKIIFIASLLFSIHSPYSSASPAADLSKSFFEEGIDLNKQHRYDEAVAKFKKAIESSLETYPFHQALFMTYVATRHGPQGIEYYKELLRTYPQNATVHYWLGRFYLEKGSLNEAVKEFQEAARLAPKDEHPWISLGHINLRLGKENEALDAYLQANKLTPHVAAVHAGLGKIYQRREAFSKARKEYEEALKLDASLTEAQYNLGLIYEKEGNYLKAIDQFKALLEQDPNESGARQRLARLYFLGEMYRQAVEEYATLSQVKQESPEVFFALGESTVMFAATLTDPVKRDQAKAFAADAFQRTVDLDPKNDRARRYLAQLHEKPPPAKQKDSRPSLPTDK